jgi:hypothetical protein
VIQAAEFLKKSGGLEKRKPALHLSPNPKEADFEKHEVFATRLEKAPAPSPTATRSPPSGRGLG